MNTRSARVMVVACEESLRERIYRALGQAQGITIEAQLTDDRGAVNLAGVLQPDVVLLQVNGAGAGLPDGMATARELRQVHPASKIILFGSNGAGEETTRSEAFRQGAWGWFPEGGWDPHDLAHAVEAAGHGNVLESLPGCSWVSFWKERLEREGPAE